MRCIRPRLPEWPKAIAYIPLLSSFFLAGCALISTRPNPLESDEVFHRTEKKRAFTSADQLTPCELPDDGDYRLCEGDIVVIEIWDRHELSGRHIIGPDGRVTLPVVLIYQWIGLPAVFGFLIWGGIVVFIAFIASLGYPVWMKLSYLALALSASTSPMRKILHVFNDLDFAYDPRVQAWTAYTSISGAAGMTITWSLLVFLTE